ncbi:LppM family (lipo)protein [Cellulomonas sp. CW35]|uniref:LppM family (lipo)protein n=1 Tax=Cellulomonas sp. CW35 TaxID=3458249 RepID=UPI0040345FCA
MSTTRRPARALALVSAMAALLLTLSGCLKLDMDLTFHADDTVDGTVVLAVSSSLLESTGMTFDEAFGSEDPFDGEATSSEAYEDGTYVGRTYHFADTPLAEFGDDDMKVTHEDGKFVVDGELDLSAGGETGLSGGEVRVAFTFPGEVESSNGTIDGSTVTWEAQAGDVVQLDAVASDGTSDGFPVLTLVWVLVGLVVVAIVVVVTVVLLRRRAARRDGVDAATVPPAPAPGGVPPAPPADQQQA